MENNTQILELSDSPQAESNSDQHSQLRQLLDAELLLVGGGNGDVQW